MMMQKRNNIRLRLVMSLAIGIFLVIVLKECNFTVDSAVNHQKFRNDEITDLTVGSKDTPRTTKYYDNFESSNCQPKQNVFYLKTYKTGSSTMASILYRYAVRNYLKIVPLYHDLFASEIDMKAIASLPEEKQTPYNILTEHIRFNVSDGRSVSNILTNDTIYITSLRHPMAQFKSFFKEFELAKQLEIDKPDPVQYFLQNLKNYSQEYRKHEYLIARKARSQICGQLGITHADLDNMTLVDNLIKSVEETFHIVMITEYFDESLIFLRRKLCWAVEDIAYISLRVRSYSSKNSAYDNTLRNTHEKWSAADYKLYDHFAKKFLGTLSGAPMDFWNELGNFKVMKKTIENFCNDVMAKVCDNTTTIFEMAGNLETGEGRLMITIDAQPWSELFTLDAVTCALMNLRSKVQRNVCRMHVLQSVCKPDVKKHHASLMESIQIQNGSVHINPAYCSNFSTFYNVPIGVLFVKGSYMFLD